LHVLEAKSKNRSSGENGIKRTASWITEWTTALPQ